MQPSEHPLDRKPSAARAWRALVDFTLAVVATRTEPGLPRIAETVAAGRDTAAPIAA